MGVGSGVGKGSPACTLELLYDVSTGSGMKRLLGGVSFFATGTSSIFCTSSFLLLLVVVSTVSTTNRRTFFTVVSTGVGVNRLEVGGGEVSDIVVT